MISNSSRLGTVVKSKMGLTVQRLGYRTISNVEYRAKQWLMDVSNASLTRSEIRIRFTKKAAR
jgi:hypothetical protein